MIESIWILTNKNMLSVLIIKYTINLAFFQNMLSGYWRIRNSKKVIFTFYFFYYFLTSYRKLQQNIFVNTIHVTLLPITRCELIKAHGPMIGGSSMTLWSRWIFKLFVFFSNLEVIHILYTSQTRKTNNMRNACGKKIVCINISNENLGQKKLKKFIYLFVTITSLFSNAKSSLQKLLNLHKTARKKSGCKELLLFTNKEVMESIFMKCI